MQKYYQAVGGNCDTVNGPKYTDYTRDEILATVDPFDWDTIEPWLKKMDYPALPSHYINYILHYKRNDEYAKTYFGKYLCKMHLCSFQSLRYEHSYYGLMGLYFNFHLLQYLGIKVFDNENKCRPIEDLAHDYVQVILKLCKDGLYDEAEKYYKGA